jgi:ubiquinone/menaquinone biosynthesis C-methylase UbiE
MQYKAKVAYQKIGVAEQYDKRRFSNIIGQLVDRLEKKAILELVENQASLRAVVIDTPCGTGRMTEILTKSGQYVVGADISKSMLLSAKERLKRNGCFDLVQCDVENLPFKDRSVEFTLSVRLMGHVPPIIRKKILLEFSRITKGQMIIAFYSPLSLLGMFKRVRRFVNGNPWFPVTNQAVRNELDCLGLHVQKTKYILSWIAETFFILIKKSYVADRNIQKKG